MCRAGGLGDLPVDRLADELRVLEIEADQSGPPSNVGFDLNRRFGPHGAGIVNYPEYGLRRITPEIAAEWARTRFSAANAVLWFSGPVPPELRLTGLPRTARPETAPLPPVRTHGRSFSAVDTSCVSLSCLYHGWSGVNTALYLARERAHDQLRRDALSYGVRYDRHFIGAGHALAQLTADAADGAHARVAQALVGLLDEFADSGPRPEEMTVYQEFRRHFGDDPQHRLASLQSAARRQLLDGVSVLPDDVDAHLDAQTVESIRDDLRDAMTDLVLVGPAGVDAELEGWTELTAWTSDWLSGTDFEPLLGRAHGTLTVGDEGVMLTLDPDRWLTIRWSDVAAVLTADNGIREVLGNSGSSILFVPWAWHGGDELTRRIDVAVDPRLVVRLGEGSTHYEDDDDKVAHVRWLATVVDARLNRHQHELMSIVIDTDGIFFVHASTPLAGHQDRLEELRASDRDTLVAADPRNRWIAADRIVVAELRQRPWTAVGIRTWTLTITTHDGEMQRIYLMGDDQVEHTRTYFGLLLGSRFFG